MFAHLPRRETHPRTAAPQAAARLRRLAAVLAALTCALLASAAIIPAASAMIRVPGPGSAYAGTPAAPVRAPTVVGAGGMAGWQITLIALGAALVAATLAVLLDRALSARRAASAPAA
jgi:hypothetical protein